MTDVSAPRRFSIPRTIWRAIYPPVLYLGLQLVVALVAGIAIAIFLPFFSSAPDPGSFTENDLMRTLTEDNLTMSIVAINAALAILIFALIYQRERRWYIQTATAPVRPKPTIALILAVVLAALGAQVVIGQIIAQFELNTYFTDYSVVEETLSQGNFFLRLFTLGLIGPIVEELCMRGLVFNRLRMRLSFAPSMLLSAAIFGIIHLNWLQSMYAFLLGLLLAWLYHRFRSLWAPILVHVVFNTSSVFLGLVTDPKVAEIVDWIMLAAVILAALALIFIAIQTKRSTFGEVIPTPLPAPAMPLPYGAPYGAPYGTPYGTPAMPPTGGAPYADPYGTPVMPPASGAPYANPYAPPPTQPQPQGYPSYQSAPQQPLPPVTPFPQGQQPPVP